MAAYELLGRPNRATHTSLGDKLPAWATESRYGILNRLFRHDALRSSFISILPRFAQPGGIRHRKIDSTSYLNALRGWAAFFVFTAHSFSSSQQDWRRHAFLYVLFSGASMVSLFFVISGYVLSYRLLILIRKGDFESFVNSLASSTFRRYVRLYGSSVAATLIIMLLVQFRIYETNEVKKLLHKDTFGTQFIDWIHDTIFFTNPFGNIPGWFTPQAVNTRYDDVLWTIAAEFRGSIALFAYCTAVCKMSTRARMISTWVVVALCYVWQAIYIAEFLGGFFIADLALSRNPERIQNPSTTQREPRNQTRKSTVLNIFLFVGGLFLLSQPDKFSYFPWNYLHRVIPSWWHDFDYIFWPSLGAFALIYALESFPALQRPLHWRLSQYLGDISFGVYVVHCPICRRLFFQIIIPWREQHLADSTLKYVPGFTLYPLLVLVAADYFDRLDRAIVRLGKSLERRLFH